MERARVEEAQGLPAYPRAIEDVGRAQVVFADDEAKPRSGAVVAETREARPGPRGLRRRERREEPTREELYEEAKRLGIDGRSTMRKRELARAVERARGAS
jgi:Rho termination factor-like protein